MESIAWHTEKTKLVVFKTSDLTGASVRDLAVVANGKHKGKPIFYGAQEFDNISGKFIYNNGAIKISSYGWIKREDLVPANVLMKENQHRKHLLGSYTSIECPDAVRKKSKNKSILENFDTLMKSMKSVIRNSEVGLCAIVGKTKCDEYIKRTKSDVDKRLCKELSD